MRLIIKIIPGVHMSGFSEGSCLQLENCQPFHSEKWEHGSSFVIQAIWCLSLSKAFSMIESITKFLFEVAFLSIHLFLVWEDSCLVQLMVWDLFVFCSASIHHLARACRQWQVMGVACPRLLRWYSQGGAFRHAVWQHWK